ncbi:MAG: HAD family hydrolase [Solirubrobacteraceae bacterium]
MLGLPVDVSACLFDLDGVLTQTATVHAAAWQETFDAFLRPRSEQTGAEFNPSDPGSTAYVEAALAGGLHRSVVSSSTNCRDVVVAAGIEGLFEQIVDGVVAEREHLRGKPAADTFLAGARALGVEPAAAAVFEDALAGVQAGRAGGFGFVIGVDRVGQADALAARGADLVVSDLADLLHER